MTPTHNWVSLIGFVVLGYLCEYVFGFHVMAWVKGHLITRQMFPSQYFTCLKFVRRLRNHLLKCCEFVIYVNVIRGCNRQLKFTKERVTKCAAEMFEKKTFITYYIRNINVGWKNYHHFKTYIASYAKNDRQFHALSIKFWILGLNCFLS